MIKKNCCKDEKKDRCKNKKDMMKKMVCRDEKKNIVVKMKNK